MCVYFGVRWGYGKDGWVGRFHPFTGHDDPYGE